MARELAVNKMDWFEKLRRDGFAILPHVDAQDKGHTGSSESFAARRPKAGVPHVEAPIELLEAMLTARIHLDDVTDANGPLRVLPGSHINRDSGVPDDRSAISIHCRAGDVLLMRPLLYHASASGDPDHREHRRVVHLEFAPSIELPDGYEWRHFVRITTAH